MTTHPDPREEVIQSRDRIAELEAELEGAYQDLAEAESTHPGNEDAYALLERGVGVVEENVGPRREWAEKVKEYLAGA